MNKLRLTPRLQAAADYVPPRCRFADIGTDHAYLPVWLLQQGRITRAIAADLRRGPLDHARETAQVYGLTECMDFRLSDGLARIAPHEADCIVIAGMGGEAVRSILEAAPWTRTDTRLILQPQSNLPRLRRWLAESGYCICQERCVRDEEHWYSVMLVQGGGTKAKLTPATELAGRPETWKRGDPWEAFLDDHIARLRRQQQGLRRSAQPDALRLDTLEETISELAALKRQVQAEREVSL